MEWERRALVAADGRLGRATGLLAGVENVNNNPASLRVKPLTERIVVNRL